MLSSLRNLLSLLVVMILLAACGPGASGMTEGQPGEARLRVVTTISPITNIVYNIGGDRIDLNGIMPPGADPHTFEPRPSDAVKLAQADLIIVNGLHLDESTQRLAEANLKEGAELVELAVEAIEPDEFIYGQEHIDVHAEDEDEHEDEDEQGHAEDEDEHEDEDEQGHAEDEDEHEDEDEQGHAEDEDEHEDEDEQGHAEDGDEHEDDDEHGEGGEPDPHLLLDPNFALRYAKVVLDHLTAHDPVNSAYYQANYDEYAARIQVLDEAIRATTASIPESNRRLLTFHGSFGYFALRYGYTVIGVIQPTDTSEPSAQEVAALIEQLLDESVPAIFGSALFPADVVDQIARETGATVSTLLDEDLPGEPGDGEHTYIGMMVENMRTLASTLGGDPSLMDGVDVENLVDS